MIEIKLSGTGIVLNAVPGNDESQWEDLYEFGLILSDIEVLANGEDITKKKGKYVKTKTYLKENYFNPICGKDGPYYLRVIQRSMDFKSYFTIDVEPDEFDPKKLQLLKSDYEVEVAPYGVIMDKVIYDGQEIEVEFENEDYCFDDNFEYGLSSYVTMKIDNLPYAE